MKINKRLLPIKAHFFFFMCAMGPILPQLSVFGKEMGISTVVMGTVTGILPFAFLIAKPLFGILVDVHRNYRKTIFMMLIIIMSLSYTLIAFLPILPALSRTVVEGPVMDYFLDTCNFINTEQINCENSTRTLICDSECFHHPDQFLMTTCGGPANSTVIKLCSPDNETSPLAIGSRNCTIRCIEDIADDASLYKSVTFWGFLLLMSIGSIAFNVVNSISDAICFDMIGEEYDYGKQRLWGTIGFGSTALIGGYIVDLFSGTTITYIPAMIVMVISTIFDLICCVKLKLPVIEAPKNIFKDIGELMNNRHVVVFMIYAIMVGVLDGYIIYFLFWYVEDLAAATNTGNIKLLEGVIVAAETLGGEVIFFSIAGKILQRFGHKHCFSMCFINYALRLGLISLAPNPWWILLVEFFFQGPTYALTYTTVVAYANELAPPGASATMQGIAAGFDDGVGYAFGSIIGGFLYKYVGGRNAFQIFSCFGILCSISHVVLHKTYLRGEDEPIKANVDACYKSPEEAVKVTAEAQ